MNERWRTATTAVTASLLTVLSLVALACVPTLNHDVKRLLNIPTELSGPHPAGERGDDSPIPGSKDFLFCALSQTSAHPEGACAVSQRADGWHVTGSGSDPRTCAVLCMK